MSFNYTLQELDDDPSQSQSQELIQPMAGYVPIAVTGLSQPSIDDDGELSDDPIEETQAGNSNKENAYVDLKDKPRWPQYKNFVRDHPSLALKLLQSVDDADAQREPNASNTNNHKGNKWANLQYVTFGSNRGSLSPYLPHIAKATDLKKKVMEIWKHCKSNESNESLDSAVLEKATRQCMECLAAVKAVEDGKVAAKNKLTTLRTNMGNYERQQNATPPGAKETAAGRINHSVNLRMGEPASYAYADSTEGHATAVAMFTPQRKKSPKEKSSSSGKSSMANENALKDNESFEANFSRLVDCIPGVKRPATKSQEDDSDADLSEGKLKEKKKLRRQRAREMKRANEYLQHIATSEEAKVEYNARVKKVTLIDKKIDDLYDDDTPSDSSRTTLGPGGK